MTAGGRELGAGRSPACSFYLAANFPDLTSKARNRSLRLGRCLTFRAPPAALFNRRLQRRPTDQKKSIDYNHLDVDEIRSTCALNLDIAQIALLHARVCLHWLVDGEPDLLGLPPEVNFITFANRVVAGVFEQPFTAKFYALAPHPACLICGTPATASASAEAVLASLFTSPSPA